MCVCVCVCVSVFSVCALNPTHAEVVAGVDAAMEKPPFRQNQSCGDWELKERLGMGGFAHVYLYKHHVSGTSSPPTLYWI